MVVVDLHREDDEHKDGVAGEEEAQEYPEQKNIWGVRHIKHTPKGMCSKQKNKQTSKQTNKHAHSRTIVPIHAHA